MTHFSFKAILNTTETIKNSRGTSTNFDRIWAGTTKVHFKWGLQFLLCVIMIPRGDVHFDIATQNISTFLVSGLVLRKPA